ncbi:hypothetical protein BV20DRAFT_994986 [Pilatotrama ljubarskyi]|nr:hypothetical protein BV20DRAFT_994986 [Pilatotrama ljubarskyi]
MCSSSSPSGPDYRPTSAALASSLFALAVRFLLSLVLSASASHRVLSQAHIILVRRRCICTTSHASSPRRLRPSSPQLHPHCTNSASFPSTSTSALCNVATAMAPPLAHRHPSSRRPTPSSLESTSAIPMPSSLVSPICKHDHDMRADALKMDLVVRRSAAVGWLGCRRLTRTRARIGLD